MINKRKKENKGRNKRRRKKSEERRKEKDRKRRKFRGMVFVFLIAEIFDGFEIQQRLQHHVHPSLVGDLVVPSEIVLPVQFEVG